MPIEPFSTIHAAVATLSIEGFKFALDISSICCGISPVILVQGTHNMVYKGHHEMFHMPVGLSLEKVQFFVIFVYQEVLKTNMYPVIHPFMDDLVLVSN